MSIEQLINSLKNHMLNTIDYDLITSNSKVKNNDLSSFQRSVPPPPKKFVDISPNSDSLFWCLYILKYSMNNYIFADKSKSTEEMEKLKWIDLLKEKKDVVKRLKLKSLTELENIHKENLTEIVFNILCVILNINIYIRFENTYIFHGSDIKSLNTMYEIVETDNKLFRLHIYEHSNYSNFFQIQISDKYLKSINFYKVSDLTILCDKLKIEIIDKKYKKKELYDKIHNYFNKN